MSIDDMAYTLTGIWCAPAYASTKAIEIRTIAAQVGEYLTCSLDVAPIRFLAEIASDMAKPNGLRS